jgi:fibronectin type 3 domain-containing protein
MLNCRPNLFLFAVRAVMVGASLALIAGCGGTSNVTATDNSVAVATIPAPPTHVTATGGDALVAIAWAGSSEATSYNVKRATTAGGPYTKIASATSLTYTDASVTNSTAYYYVVSAVDAAGESANSPDATATPEAPAEASAVPAQLTATAGNSQVSLIWSASKGASSYDVKRSTTSGGPYSQIATPTTTSYTDTGLTNSTTYYYVVAAANSAGASANSVQVSATPTATGVGSITSISPASGGVGTVVTIMGTNLAGATPAVACYGRACSGITIITGGSQIGAVTDGSFVIVSNSEIQYTMPADGATGQFYFGNPNGTAFASSNFTFVPKAVTAAPTNLQQVSGSAEVDLKWNGVPNGLSYNLKRSTASGGPYTTIANLTNALAYSDFSVTNGVTYYYVVSCVDSVGESANSSQVTANPVAPTAGTVTITVKSSSTQSISPYIYGVNGGNSLSNQFPSGTSSSLPSGTTLDRFGGNRLTAYNWTTNASNAGSDYLYENDAELNTSPNSYGTAVTQRITFDRANGMATMMTFPMQGYVAADESGPVATPFPNLSRFVVTQYAKGSAFTTTPSTTGAVYDDEFAYNINHAFSGQGIFTSSPATYPVFGQLDNEPDLWTSTHQEIQGSTLPTVSAFIAKSISLATALKNQYPQMVIFGPVNWGWSGVQSWQNNISGTTNTSNNWFIDQYAAAMQTASTSYGSALVNVYDFHWYPQVVDSATGSQIGNLNSSPLTAAQTQEIVQWPRSLYDSTYVENSWIPGTIGGNAINALPRFQAKLASDNPSMKLSITEYFPGGGATIAGTLAEADLLGAFGANGLYAASLWPLTTTFPSIDGGFAAFRNFDGAGSNYGNVAVAASSSNIANVSAYVSTDTTHSGRVVMVIINRSTTAQNTTITGQALSGTAHIYQMTSSNIPSSNSRMVPTSIGTQSVSGSSITITVPSLSVTTIDIR